jgi:hypothetical protein
VTALELRLHPVTRVYAGTATFPIARAAETLARYRDWAPSQPDELTTALVLTKGSLVIRAAYVGEADAAERALRPLWHAAGAPLTSDLRPMGYAETASLGGTPPRQFELFADLPDAVIRAAVDAVTRADAPASAVDVRHWGGAPARPGAGAGPVGHRDVPFSITVDGPSEAAAPLARHATGGSFLNFLQDPARTHTAYTAGDYRRLREIKRAHDPGNVFGLTHNIPPATAARYPSAQGTSTESSVGESRATTYSAASASDRF